MPTEPRPPPKSHSRSRPWPLPCPEYMADWSINDTEDTSAPVEACRTLKKWQSTWEYYILLVSDFAAGICVRLRPDRNYDTARSWHGKWATSSSKVTSAITITTSTTSRVHGRLIHNDAEDTSAPIKTCMTLEKVTVNVGILSPPRSGLAAGI